MAAQTRQPDAVFRAGAGGNWPGAPEFPAGGLTSLPVGRRYRSGAQPRPEANRWHANRRFTGSTEIGRQLSEQCAKDIKSVAELGGNAPFIVLTMPIRDKAVEGAGFEVSRNAGRSCPRQ